MTAIALSRPSRLAFDDELLLEARWVFTTKESDPR